jgi:hypothetical protein
MIYINTETIIKLDLINRTYLTCLIDLNYHQIRQVIRINIEAITNFNLNNQNHSIKSLDIVA